MASDAIKAKTLADVARGETIAGAARNSGISLSQARNAIFRICRQYGLSSDLPNIRANPKKYLTVAKKILDAPRSSLSSRLIYDLQKKLRLHPNDISPRYFSNLTAEQLIDRGVTEQSLADIQNWLSTNKTSLKRKAPNGNSATRAAKRAIDLLDSFGFEVAQVKAQFNQLDG